MADDKTEAKPTTAAAAPPKAAPAPAAAVPPKKVVAPAPAVVEKPSPTATPAAATPSVTKSPTTATTKPKPTAAAPKPTTAAKPTAPVAVKPSTASKPAITPKPAAKPTAPAAVTKPAPAAKPTIGPYSAAIAAKPAPSVIIPKPNIAFTAAAAKTIGPYTAAITPKPAAKPATTPAAKPAPAAKPTIGPYTAAIAAKPAVILPNPLLTTIAAAAKTAAIAGWLPPSTKAFANAVTAAIKPTKPPGISTATKLATKPATAAVKPAITTAAPKIAPKPATAPKPVNTAKPASATKPSVTKIATAKPTTIAPAKIAPKPSTAAAKPAVAAPKPAVTAPKAASATARPATATAVKPVTAQPVAKPAAAASKPAFASPAQKPTLKAPTTAVKIVQKAAVTKPTTAATKPAVTKPAVVAPRPTTTAAAKPVTTAANITKPAPTAKVAPKPVTAVAKPATTAPAKPVAKPVAAATIKPATAMPVVAPKPAAAKPTTATTKPVVATTKPVVAATAASKPVAVATKPVAATAAKPTTTAAAKPVLLAAATAATAKPAAAAAKPAIASPAQKRVPVSVGPNDILFGKDGTCSTTGSKGFDKIILPFLDPYKDFKSRNEGFRVLESIRGHISHRGGRFLQTINGKHYEMTAKAAIISIELALDKALIIKEAERAAAMPKVKLIPTGHVLPKPSSLTQSAKRAKLAPGAGVAAPVRPAQVPVKAAAGPTTVSKPAAQAPVKTTGYTPVLLNAKGEPATPAAAVKTAPSPAPTVAKAAPTNPAVAAVKSAPVTAPIKFLQTTTPPKSAADAVKQAIASGKCRRQTNPPKKAPVQPYAHGPLTARGHPIVGVPSPDLKMPAPVKRTASDEARFIARQEELIARGGVEIPFPWKLHEMLEDTYNANQEWIVSWQPHGRSFLVHKPDVFVEKIMPTYFNQSKFASFQRQLNLYGFQRLSTGKDKGAYYHRSFLRGQPDLCHKVFRIKIKGTKVRRKIHSEPDFYRQSYMPYITKNSTATRTAIQSSLGSQPPRPATARYHTNIKWDKAMSLYPDKESAPHTASTTKGHPPTTGGPPMTLIDKVFGQQPSAKASNGTIATKGPSSVANQPTNTSPPKEKVQLTANGHPVTLHAQKKQQAQKKDIISAIRRNSATSTKGKASPPKASSSSAGSNSARNEIKMKSPRTVVMKDNQRGPGSTVSRVSGQKRPAPASRDRAERTPREQSVNELRIQVGNLAQASVLKDQEIRRLRQELASNSNQVDKLRKAASAKDQEIVQLTEELAVKDRKLAKLENGRGKVIKGLFAKDTWENMDTFRDNLYI